MKMVKISCMAIILMAIGSIYAMEAESQLSAIAEAPAPVKVEYFDRVSDYEIQLIISQGVFNIRDLIRFSMTCKRFELILKKTPIVLEEFTGMPSDIKNLISILPKLEVISLNLEPFAEQVTDEALACILDLCPNLNTLSLRGCEKITVRGFARLATTHLINLDIGGSRVVWETEGGESITDECLDKLPASLASLRIAGCRRLTEKGFANLTRFEHLSSLDVSETSITDEYLDKLPASLASLRIARCERLTEKGFANLSRFEHLRNLDVSETSITNEYLDKLPASLVSLKIKNCDRLTSRGFAKLSKLQNLRRLDVRGPNITDECLISLEKLPLTMLNIGLCEIITHDCLTKMPASLISLKLVGRKDFIVGPDIFARLEHLRELYIIGHSNPLISDVSLSLLPKSLTSLIIVDCQYITAEGLGKNLTKLPILASLDISDCRGIKSNRLASIVSSCPNLNALHYYDYDMLRRREVKISEEIKSELLIIHPGLKIIN